MSARLKSKGRKITIIQCNASINAAEEREEDEFYSALKSMIYRTPRKDIKIVMGDLNANDRWTKRINNNIKLYEITERCR